MLNNLKAVIFDFDGVIVESNSIKNSAFYKLAKKYHPHSKSIIDYHLSNNHLSRQLKFEFFAENIFKKENRKEIIETLDKDYTDFTLDKIINCSFVKGLHQLLDFLKLKCDLFISSVTPIKDLTKIIEAKELDRYFLKIFGNPPTSKEQAIFEIQKNYSKNEILLIGDSESDYRAAKESGINFLGRISEHYWQNSDIQFVPNLLEAKKYIQTNFRI